MGELVRTPHEAIRRLVNLALARAPTDFIASQVRARPGAVVIDVGTNVGDYLPQWFELGASCVHAFEPVPAVFAELMSRWGDDPRVIVNRLAVADTRGRLTGLRVLNAHTLADPAAVRLDLALEDAGPFDMETVRLDDYVSERMLEAVDFIKLDVDGYEPKALRGMRDTLRRFRPPVMVELSFLPRALGENCEAMVDDLYGSGYRLCTMAGQVCEDPVLVLEAFPWRTSFDMLAVPIERIAPDWPRVR